MSTPATAPYKLRQTALRAAARPRLLWSSLAIATGGFQLQRRPYRLTRVREGKPIPQKDDAEEVRR